MDNWVEQYYYYYNIKYMDYQLALKLKEAGFPQNGKDCNWIIDEESPLDEIYTPTLSELIEACGEEFLSLAKFGKIWEAFRHKELKPEVGNTPEEAVANLWLELNKK